MRKILPVLLALALMLGLCACGNYVSILPGTQIDAAAQPESGTQGETGEDVFEEQPLYDFMGWSEFGGNYYSDTPIAMSFQYNGGSEGCVSPVFDRASIIAACDALRSMTVTGEAADGDNADEMVFTFTMSTSSSLSIL